MAAADDVNRDDGRAFGAGLVERLDAAIDDRHPVAVTGAELDRRRAAAAAAMTADGFDLLVGFAPASIAYLTGMTVTPAERPVAVLLDGDGRRTVFVPRLVRERTETLASAERVVSYPEFPSRQHPMRHLAALIAETAPGAARIVAEADGYPWINGYAGPPLADVLSGPSIHVDPAFVARFRLVKSFEELVLLRHACRWAERAHRELQSAVAPGRRESAVAGAATGAAMAAFRGALGDRPELRRDSRVFAGFGGQVGAGSADHVPRSYDPELVTGDVLITAVGAAVGGYHCELERVLFIGRPRRDLADTFAVLHEMQTAALDAIRPGRTCGEIEEVVDRLFARHGVTDLWRHHVGHGLGLEPREAPFFDVGDGTVLQPGMVLSVEPGLYLAGVAGFRQSDCIVVTEASAERLTRYPSDLSDLVCQGGPA